jgi:hypothetical protein
VSVFVCVDICVCVCVCVHNRCGSMHLAEGDHKIKTEGFQHHGGAYETLVYR